MRNFIFTFCFFIFSCSSREVEKVIVVNIPEYPVAIEINSIPPPFNLNGHNPYVVWMNGKRITLPKKDLLLLVDKVGKKNIPIANHDDIHRGWLFPYFAKTKDEELLNSD